MYISIDSDNTLSLQDCENFKQFSIRVNKLADATIALQSIGTAAEDNHYWLDANAVVSLSDCANDPVWVERFWAMLKQVEAYGYSDVGAQKIKAHIE